MIVLLDANVWLSYLANSSDGGSETVENAIRSTLASEKIRLIIPQETVEEVERILATKRYYIYSRAGQAWATIRPLLHPSILPDRIMRARNRIGPDANDDYLLVAMHQYEVDYLVTGDRALLGLRTHAQGMIISPANYLRLLEASGLAQV